MKPTPELITPTTVPNPWFCSPSPYSKPTFTYPGKSLLTYRGFDVFKNPEGSWDYLFDGLPITQRAGFDPTKGREIIDEILAGKVWITGDVVRKHLRDRGVPVYEE